jgi:hypothetical protein
LEFQSPEAHTHTLAPRTTAHNDARKADDAQLDQKLLWFDSPCITGSPNAPLNSSNNSSSDESSLASASKQIKNNNLEFQSPEEEAFYELRSLLKNVQSKLKWKYHFGDLGGHVYILPGRRGERQGGTRPCRFLCGRRSSSGVLFQNQLLGTITMNVESSWDCKTEDTSGTNTEKHFYIFKRLN